LRVNFIHQQRAGRRTVLEPAVIAAIDLHQFAETCAPGARLVDLRWALPARHPETRVHRSRTVRAVALGLVVPILLLALWWMLVDWSGHHADSFADRRRDHDVGFHAWRRL